MRTWSVGRVVRLAAPQGASAVRALQNGWRMLNGQLRATDYDHGQIRTMQLVIDHSYLIPLLPLLGAVVAGFFGDRLLKGRAHWPIWIGVGCSFALLSFVLLIGMLHACPRRDRAGPIQRATHWSTLDQDRPGRSRATPGSTSTR